MLWLVPGLAFTKYRCEFVNLFCIYALGLGLVLVWTYTKCLYSRHRPSLRIYIKLPCLPGCLPGAAAPYSGVWLITTSDCIRPHWTMPNHVCRREIGQIFRIGTVRYAKGLWCMRRHGPVIAHCADSEDFPEIVISKAKPKSTGISFNLLCCAIWIEGDDYKRPS